MEWGKSNSQEKENVVAGGVKGTRQKRPPRSLNYDHRVPQYSLNKLKLILIHFNYFHVFTHAVFRGVR